jgi:hypothetical protein
LNVKKAKETQTKKEKKIEQKKRKPQKTIQHPSFALDSVYTPEGNQRSSKKPNSLHLPWIPFSRHKAANVHQRNPTLFTALDSV